MVAYLILSYTHPELVYRLVARLRPGLVAVHHDGELGPVDALRLPPSPVEWGHGSQLAAILRALRHLREHDWDWLVLLSGQDYPVRPVPAIERDLLAAPVDAFIRHRPVTPSPRRRGRVDELTRRYHYRWRPARAAALAKLDPLVQLRRLPSGPYLGLPARPPLPVFHGSDWCSLSRRAVEALLAAPVNVVDHFLHTIIPTEAFAHTVLANSGLALADDHRRYAVFDPPTAPSPRIFGLHDLDAVLASGADFARKFDDLAVLDEIDRRVHA